MTKLEILKLLEEILVEANAPGLKMLTATQALQVIIEEKIKTERDWQEEIEYVRKKFKDPN